GIAGRPVTELAVAPLAAAFSTHRDADELAVSEECLWAHERVVEALMAERAVLPVRFGAAFGDERALTAALEPRREELARDLERVRDRVELGVRIRVDAPDARARARAARPDTGRAPSPDHGAPSAQARRRRLAQRRRGGAAGGDVHEARGADGRAEGALRPRRRGPEPRPRTAWKPGLSRHVF